jgi:hypothetical protein
LTRANPRESRERKATGLRPADVPGVGGHDSGVAIILEPGVLARASRLDNGRVAYPSPMVRAPADRERAQPLVTRERFAPVMRVFVRKGDAMNSNNRPIDIDTDTLCGVVS